MFSEEQKVILQRYFTNTDSGVFALVNLPEVIKGTLFSRYSRTAKNLRQLFLDEFVNAEVLNEYFQQGGASGAETVVNTAKADDFYERILVGYGDDSVAELGGAHAALEDISCLATKSIEEHRIGLSPLEKSTRYVYYDQKVDGQYQYIRDQNICASEYRELYLQTNDALFDAYSTIVRDIQKHLKAIFSGDENEAAYKFSIRAKACDLARGLLPLSTKTNMGVYGNGRAFEYLLTHLFNDPLSEVRDIAAALDENLKRVISAFIKRATNERGQKYRAYLSQTKGDIYEALEGKVQSEVPTPASGISVELLEADTDPVGQVIAGILYRHSNMRFVEAQAKTAGLSEQEREKIFHQFLARRENRHHKPGRELEHPMFTFEVVADWGVYKDLMRHRILTRYHQLFTTELGYWIPEEVEATGFGAVYRSAMERANDAYCALKERFPHEAQYVVTHGSYNRFVMRMNLRAVVHMTELRASPQGHPTYRKVAQEMAKRVSEKFPLLGKYCFPFVDFRDYELERLDAFRKIEKKAAAVGAKGFEE